MIPTLLASNPTIINATYDKIWVEEIVISAPNINGDATARVRLRKFRTTESGGEFSPDSGEWLQIDSLLMDAESDSDLSSIIISLMGYIAKKGIESGIIKQQA